jgi:hypothetical protein
MNRIELSDHLAFVVPMLVFFGVMIYLATEGVESMLGMVVMVSGGVIGLISVWLFSSKKVRIPETVGLK